MIARPIASLFRQTPGTARSGEREHAAECRPDGRAHGGNLILGLDRAHIQVLEPRERVQHIGRRRDRIAAVDQGLSGEMRGSDAAEGKRHRYR